MGKSPKSFAEMIKKAGLDKSGQNMQIVKTLKAQQVMNDIYNI